MANKPITMLQIQRIIQLLAQNKSQRFIAKHLDISRNTVYDYVLKLKQSAYSYEELALMDNETLSVLIYTQAVNKNASSRYLRLQSRLNHFLEELSKPHVSRMLLWEEYCQSEEDPYSYSQFCEHIFSSLQTHNAVMHFEHQPGDKLEIDFAGDMLYIVDKHTGEEIKCPVFVGMLPCSNYIYAQALPNATLPQFIGALNNCLQFIGGVPSYIVSDNMRQYVIKSNRYDPEFNELTQQLSVHYDTSLLAARVRKPRDKASVEKAVDIVYKRVYALLRNEVFHSLESLNYRIGECLDLLNKRPMQNRDVCRHDLWLAEKESLKKLPDIPFEVKHSVTAKVQKNYHILLGEDRNQYSVPYQYIGKKVKAIYDTTIVEIYYDHKRIALHKRSYRKHDYSTVKEHMPLKHQHYNQEKGWDENHFLDQGKKVGQHCYEVIQTILETRKFTQQGFNACLGILRLKSKYGAERLENACRRTLQGTMISYRTVETILSTGQDKQVTLFEIMAPIPSHENIRGASKYSN